MGYVQNTLTKGETIKHSGKLHWITFSWPIIFILLAVMSASSKDAMGVFITLGLFTGLLKFLNFTSSEFVITDKRVVLKSGVIKRKSTDLLISKVEGINVDQGILGRMLSYGTIRVGGTGGSKDGFKSISDPLLFRKMFQEQIDENEVTK